MENKILFGLSLMAAMSFSACQKNEMVNEGDNALNARLQVEASVSGMAARTTSSLGDGHTSFADGDKIGLFMPDSDEATAWSYNGGAWSSAPQDWPSQSGALEFCAYYPYVEGAQRASIAMPDLNTQSGKLEDLGSIDFLVAKRSVSYKDNNGKVSFTGDYAFKHQYSLLVITLVKEEGDSETTINTATLSGSGIFGKHTYSFAAPEGMKAVGEEVTADKLEVTVEKEVGTEGCQVVLALNPLAEKTKLDFSISYTRDGANYTASTQGIDRTFVSGTCYKYKIRIRKQGLVVEGSEVTNWNTEEIKEDIVVNDTPQE